MKSLTCLCTFYFFIYLPVAVCLKILVFQTAAGHSHMQFSGSLIDVLADAGHEAHLLVIDWNTNATNIGTTKATSTRRIHSVTSFAYLPHLTDPFKLSFWQVLMDRKQMAIFTNLTDESCKLLINDDELLAWMRNEKFDAVVSSLLGSCQFGLFHIAGIRPVFGFLATPPSHNLLNIFGIDTPSSYSSNNVLAFESADEMNFWERTINFMVQNMIHYFMIPKLVDRQNKFWLDRYGPSYPSLTQLTQKISYVFINTVEFFEIPRQISHKIVYIGGIAVKKPKKLNKFYDNLLKQRKGNVLLSFGSLARTSLMPQEMITAFLEAFIQFPEYTFIWKTDLETMNDELFKNYANVKLVEWMPQNDLLRDGRIDAFITHAGHNSLEEAIHAGVPMITIPLFGDQIHNAAVARKRRIGYSLQKMKLSKDIISDALKAVLYDKTYKSNASELMLMINHRPISTNEIFLKYVEFATEYKSAGDNLELRSIHLNILQLYCLDVILFITLIIIFCLFIIYKLFMKILRKIKASIYGLKKKKL